MELFSRKYILIALATAVTVASVGLGIFFLSKSHLGDSFKAGFEEGYKSTRGN